MWASSSRRRRRFFAEGVEGGEARAGVEPTGEFGAAGELTGFAGEVDEDGLAPVLGKEGVAAGLAQGGGVNEARFALHELSEGAVRARADRTAEKFGFVGHHTLSAAGGGNRTGTGKKIARSRCGAGAEARDLPGAERKRIISARGNHLQGCAAAPGPQARAIMESHEVMKEVLKRTSAKQIAAEMQLSLSLIYKWAELPEDDSGSGTGSPLDRVGQLIRITKDARVAQWVCEQADGFFIRNPQNLPPNQALIPLTNGIVQEFADMLAAIAISSADSIITKEEAKKIRSRWEELKTVTEGFVRAAESGNFGPAKGDEKT